MTLERRRALMKAFIESQFGSCLLIWMFWGKNSNIQINHLHERALRVIYNDNQSSFEHFLLRKIECLKYIIDIFAYLYGGREMQKFLESKNNN